MEASYERLQHRRDADLPPLPAGLVRGSAESVLAPVEVQPVQVIPPTVAGPTVADQVEGVREQLEREAPDRPPSRDETGLFPWVNGFSISGPS
jgi:hypothetical protein